MVLREYVKTLLFLCVILNKGNESLIMCILGGNFMEKLALLGGSPTVTLDYNKIGKVPVVPEKAYKTVEGLMRGSQ